MNQSSHLPLKLNMSGVIPPIFASSLIMFPATASSWFSQASDARWLQTVTQALAPGEPLHLVLYGLLIIGFAFFYTALVFNSQETADNLKKSGALIPGIRPGKATADYIDGVLTRLTGWGALYLVAVCLLPEIMRSAWAVPFYFGGTSLLIVVVVVMDFTAQIQGSPDVASVREPDEESQSEGRFPRRPRPQLTNPQRGRPGRRLPSGLALPRSALE